MKHQNFRAAYLWRLKDSLKGAGVFVGVMLVVYVLMVCGVANLLSGDAEANGTFAAWSFSAAIMIFVFGIVTIRDDMRLMSQFGTGRSTTFWANAAAAVTVSAVVALAGEIFNGAGDAMARASGSFSVTDFYALLYCGGAQLDLAGHAASFAFTLALLLLAYAGGLLVSLCFYRLPKLGKILLAVALPTVILNGIPMVIVRYMDCTAFFNFMTATAGNWIMIDLIAAILLAAGAYLLFRRAPIRAAKR